MTETHNTVDFWKGMGMKLQKFPGIVLTVCELLLSLAGCASSSTFDGSSIKNADFCV